MACGQMAFWPGANEVLLLHDAKRIVSSLNRPAWPGFGPGTSLGFGVAPYRPLQGAGSLFQQLTAMEKPFPGVVAVNPRKRVCHRNAIGRDAVKLIPRDGHGNPGSFSRP